MADISIQFYATEQEISAWLTEWVAPEGITLVAMKFEPFSVKEVELQEIADIVCNRDVRRLCLFASEPNLDVQSKYDFEHKNTDELVLDVGHLSADGLGESWLACRSENANALAKWRRIAKSLKAKTNAGVTAINRQSGGSGFYKSTRYSEGAKDIEDAGTQMLPIAGTAGPIIRLGNVAGCDES